MKWPLTLALANPGMAAIILGIVLAVVGGAAGGFCYHFYHNGELHERAAWEQKVEEQAAKRDAERAAAQRDQNDRAEAQAKLEVQLAAEQQEHADDLARALAANSASNAPLGIVPSAVLQPFRALRATGKAAVGNH